MTDSSETVSDLQTLEALASLEATIQSAHQRLEQILATVQDYEGVQELLEEVRQSQAAMTILQQCIDETTAQLQARQEYLERATHRAQETIDTFAPLMAKIEFLAGADETEDRLQALRQALATHETHLEQANQALRQSIATDLQPLSSQVVHLRTANRRMMFAVIAIGVIALIGLFS